MTHRALAAVRVAPVAQMGDRLASREIHQALGEAELDPFLVVSLFEMTGPVFPPHPHAGFSVATYILPESPVGFINQDSLGTRNEIKPGGLHATVAGAGVLHEEQPVHTGGVALGYQIWIDHRNGERAVPPRPETLEAADVPIWREGGAELRVLIGAARGLASPVRLPTAVRLLDITLAPDTLLEESVASAERGFVVAVRGEFSVATQRVTAGSVATLGDSGETLAIKAGPSGARLTLFVGEPLSQTRVLGGPVVAGSKAEAAAFLRAASTGAFGTLRPFDATSR